MHFRTYSDLLASLEIGVIKPFTISEVYGEIIDKCVLLYFVPLAKGSTFSQNDFMMNSGKN